MAVEDEIAFLEVFREKISAFLVDGTIPTKDPLWGGSGLINMEEAMKNPSFRTLRKEINRMKGRAAQLLEGLSINCTFTQYPPPAVGGPVEKFPLFNLITDNQSLHTVDGSVFTDKIDEAIGLLEARCSGDLSFGSLPIFEVSDLTAALDFYQRILAFTARNSDEMTDAAIIVNDGACIMLYMCDNPAPSRTIVRHTHPNEALGQEMTLGGHTYLAITDLDGNRLLYEKVV